MCAGSVKPLFLGFAEQDYRHTVMNRPHKFIRFGRDDSERLHPFPIRFSPYIPQASEGERLLSFEMNPHRDLALAFFAPLIETVSRDDAAASIYQKFERR